MRTGLTCALAALLAVAAVPVSAASAVVTVTPTTLVFTAPDLSAPALAGAPASASASITFTTTAGGSGGTVTVNAVSLTSVPAGATLDQRNFTLTCTRTGGNNGFVAAPPAALSGSGATTCGTLIQGRTGVTSTFTIQLTLNDTAGATVPFAAATYLATFTVVATAT